METPTYEKARRFVYTHGRLLERRLLEVLFEDADPRTAIAALSGYRNPDGGFGNGLEPDKRVPASQPLDVEVAFQVMEAAGSVDTDAVMAACDFLGRLGGGVGCLTGPYLDYPHAEHWGGDWATMPGVNPTAGIVAALCRWDVDHPWRSSATEFCWSEIEAGLPGDAHGFGEVLAFLAAVPDRGKAEAFAPQLAERVGSLAMFRLDPGSDGYGLTPLHLAPAPDSSWIGLFDAAIVDSHLDALEAAQEGDGGWPISWETFSVAATLDCRGAETLRALRVLKAFGRLA